jgi:phosphomannomutase
MAGIFKAYDIRGIYGQTLDEDLAYRIGRAFVTFVKCGSVVVGRDMRPHSKPLFDALARGLTEQGADVVDLGLCSTPMSYHANGVLKADAGIMITASHNPGAYNGFKLSRERAIPISGDTGIRDIEAIVSSGAFAPAPARAGRVRTHDPLPAYRQHIRAKADLRRPVRIAADFANSMGVCEARVLDGLIAVKPLFDTLDGTFPNHEANPLMAETLEVLQHEVRTGRYDFGVAFDGDADRAGFLDERGAIVPMDLMTALIAQSLLAHEKGTVLYDLRSSWSVAEVIRESGGKPMMSRVGHAFIKQQMRENDAIFAGELSGHYYFRHNFYTESSSLATLCVANLVSASDRPLSELVRPLRRYAASGEINSEVADTAAVLARLKATYADGRLATLDGISVEYADWWFNVRASNTEPFIRLNLEAKTPDLMARKRDEVLALIRA